MRKILAGLAIVALITTAAWLKLRTDQKQAIGLTPVINNQQNQTNEFNKQLFSLKDPSSIWVIVNKKNPLPDDYAPGLTVPKVKLRLSSGNEQMKISDKISQPLEEMFASA